MGVPVNVLLVEDSADDAELVCLALQEGGFDVTSDRVDTRQGMLASLASGRWDVVISDYDMPLFNGIDALAALRETDLDTPFIVVSGTIGEDTAVDVMKAGANDYVLKRDLTRLAPAVRREVEGATLRREGRRARAQAQAATEDLEVREMVVEHMPIGVMVLDWIDPPDPRSFRVLWQNTAARAAVAHGGIAPGDPDDAAPCLPEPLDMEMLGSLAEVLDSGRPRSMKSLVGAGQRKAIWDVEAVPLGKHRGAVFLFDVTERRSLEQQMRVAQRMEAVGRLAGGIAHDFNNLLTVILSYTEVFLAEFRPGDPIRDDIAMIREAGQRAARLTSQLLAFSSQQPREPIALSLNNVVTDLERMLRRLIGEDVALVIEPAADLDVVIADPTQIEQILMNLAVNARDAMPGGGTLTIETAMVKLDESLSAVGGGSVAAGRYAMLVVSDTGVGMDEELQRHIFEPFYTTKDKGRGTGLGLSTVYGIVQQSGGHLVVSSQPGQGTTFKIYLPCADGAAAPVRQQLLAQAPGGSETVLVAEDEELVRRTAVRILSTAGYQVLEAAHGAEAVFIAERQQGPIHLLLTDVVMPHGSGRELADRLLRVHPEMCVIYMSGYTSDTALLEGLAAEGAASLLKPFSVAALLHKVREVLDSPSLTTEQTGR